MRDSERFIQKYKKLTPKEFCQLLGTGCLTDAEFNVISVGQNSMRTHRYRFLDGSSIIANAEGTGWHEGLSDKEIDESVKKYREQLRYEVLHRFVKLN